jgi:internalin A
VANYASSLDLGNCGMTEVPEEIGECVWLEELILSNGSWDIDDINFNKSANPGSENKIKYLPKGLNNLVNLTRLLIGGDFRNNWTLSDLSNLSDLKGLRTLICANTEVEDLSPLENLINLRNLDCSSTRVSDLHFVSGLPSLQILSLSNTSVNDLSLLSNLTQLKNVIAHNTEVSNLSPLKSLYQITAIEVSKTQITSLLPLSKLQNLTWLNITDTDVSDLSPLVNLSKLKDLFASFTRISDLSPLVGLKQLNSLLIAKTDVVDLSFLSDLTQLEYLSVSRTQISDLSPLNKLIKLITIDASSTEIWDLSPLMHLVNSEREVRWRSPGILLSMGRAKPYNKEPLSKGTNIFVRDCPLIIPPLEFAQESPQAVRDYFEELGDNGQKLNEVKVIFLGEASAGKTSLVKRLMGENFDSKESQTHGIRIRKMPFQMVDGDTVTAHFWDFGGQEVMHATHQFFLSQRSVYVLLLNSRNDDQAEKWLKHAASFGGRSPVLMVLNKIDENPSFQVDNKRLKEKYPQIRDFFRLSAKTDTGLAEFSEALRSEIDKADTRRTPFPPHWLAVKEHFSNMTADYIDSAAYRKVCEDKGVTRQFSQDVLLKFLHDLGVVINFDKLKNFDTQILNPLWLTNGVYRIINSKLVAEETSGLLREQDFDAVINDPRYNKENTTDQVFDYPKNKLQYIVRVMQEFELCFQLDTSNYVVPQLLPVQEPDFKAEGAMLRFVIHFPDFMPDSIFPRLMVKLHTFLAAEGSDGTTSSRAITKNAWRTGMILHKPNIFKALARVRWDKEDQKILVDVCGEERRRFLSFIRETVKEIVEGFTNLNISELVPIPESKEFLEYEGLVEAEKAGEKEIFVWQVKKKLSVADLLDGVEEAAMRDEVEQLPVRAFVSYSHADLEYLKELRNALSTLVRLNKLQIWDDRDIDAGDEWEKVIFQQLEESDIVLCLVSADFVASDFCYKKEFGAALEAHRKGEKTIVPIMLRKTDWKDLPLAEIQGTPGEWITLMRCRFLYLDLPLHPPPSLLRR